MLTMTMRNWKDVVASVESALETANEQPLHLYLLSSLMLSDVILTT
jgi:hypothetical protein